MLLTFCFNRSLSIYSKECSMKELLKSVMDIQFVMYYFSFRVPLLN
jgi:hypothetical protein